MKRLYDVRMCRKCGIGYNILRKMINRLPSEIVGWPEIIGVFGIDCCEHPDLNNGWNYIGHFYLED